MARSTRRVTDGTDLTQKGVKGRSNLVLRYHSKIAVENEFSVVDWSMEECAGFLYLRVFVIALIHSYRYHAIIREICFGARNTAIVEWEP